MKKTILFICLFVCAFIWGGLTFKHQIFPHAALKWLAQEIPLGGSHSNTSQWVPPNAVRTRNFSLNRRKVDVVMAGDSRIERFEWQDAFPDWAVANRGLGGDTTAGLLARVHGITAASPKLVYTMVGINDLAAGTDRADVLSSYAALLQTLDHAGAKPIIQSTLTCRIHQRCPLSDLLWLNQELEVLARPTRIWFSGPSTRIRIRKWCAAR